MQYDLVPGQPNEILIYLAAVGSNSGGRIPILLRADSNTVKTLEAKNFEIGFCLRTVVLRVIKSNLKEMSNKEVSVEQLQADEFFDLSSLFNTGLDLDKESETDKMDVVEGEDQHH
uniref:Uncharacterized protein n=1 Tax=Megaselia scalaris TaxID=36166 RepID=T1GEH3_MEGSC